MDEEIWKPIFGHEPYYMVSNLGRVKSVDRMIKRAESKGGGFQKLKGRILKPYFNKDGYKSFAISIDGKRYSKYVHICVYSSFFPLDKSKVIDHKDGDCLNNNLNNLRQITQRENVAFGSMRRGKSTGVSINPPNYKKRYRARIRIQGKHKDLGSFHTEQEAKDAYLTALNNITQNGKSNSISS